MLGFPVVPEVLEVPQVSGYLEFPGVPVSQDWVPLFYQSQKHLGIILDTKLNFQEYIKNILTKDKTIGLLRKLQNILPRASLLAIFKSFFRAHLDYSDVIYEQNYNNTFHQKMKSIQYHASLAIAGAIRGSSMEKLYQVLGLESLQQR